MTKEEKGIIGILKTSMSANEISSVGKVINKVIADKDKKIADMEKAYRKTERNLQDMNNEMKGRIQKLKKQYKVLEPNALLDIFQVNGVGSHAYSIPTETYEISGDQISKIVKEIEILIKEIK